VSDLLRKVDEKYKKACRLQALLFEVTHRCMCDCRHCFLVKDANNELSLDEIAGLLKALREEGAIFIGFTGGEPFLRKDFPRILELARDDGFFVSILTTGIPVGEREASLLKRLAVYRVEMSLLGANAETHDSIMRFPGAFARTKRAVELLVEAGVGVSLKSTVMRHNHAELADMAALARDLGAGFSANVSVAPRTDGDRQPQALALKEEEVARLDPGLLRGGLIPGEDDGPGAVLTCRAGRTVAGLSPEGDVFPCLLFREKVGNIRENTLREIWHDNPVPFLQELRRVKPEDVAECLQCEIKAHCKRCPGVAYMETGAIGLPSSSACAAARGMAAARCKS
jgi:radical SAM protein with 4Fe4S-binding SPASM domain